MSACGPHGNGARSKRGSRSASCARHHAAISSTSALIRGASSARAVGAVGGERVEDADRAAGDRRRPVLGRSGSRTTARRATPARTRRRAPPRARARRRSAARTASLRPLPRDVALHGRSSRGARRCQSARGRAGEPRLGARKQPTDVLPVQREDPERRGGRERRRSATTRRRRSRAPEARRRRASTRPTRSGTPRRSRARRRGSRRPRAARARTRPHPRSRPSSRPSRTRGTAGRACPTIAAAPASTPTQSPPSQRPSAAGTNPFATSSSATGTPSERPVHPPDVRRADVPAPPLADVLAADQPREDVAERDGAEQVARDDDRDVRHCDEAYACRRGRRPYAAGMRYVEIQPFTTSQSRFSKNASMYDPRSVW